MLQIILTHEHADATLGLDDIRVVQPFSHTNDIDPTPVYLTQYAMDRYFYTLRNTRLFKIFASTVGIIYSGIAYFIFGTASLHNHSLQLFEINYTNLFIISSDFQITFDG